ncbi:MAG: helix-turn-helix transcriptional regulator [Pseudomonadota bacterium]
MLDFSETLKKWRKARRFSQLDLAVEANVSSRHISFLETGRARPSREMIGRLGEALDLPLSAHNQLLTGAGFAARYAVRQWESAEMAPIRAAVDHTLSCHAPYPALAIDRLWTVVRMNPAATRLYGVFGVGEGDSILDLLVSDDLPPLVENWPDVARHAAQRLRTESAAQGGIAALDRVADTLTAEPLPPRQPLGPVVPTILRMGDLRLSLFATIAQFGTPEDVTLDDLKIELFFPADAETEAALRHLAGHSSDKDPPKP